MPHIQIKLLPKPGGLPAPTPPMPNPRLLPQDPFVQARLNQGPGFALKPPPVDSEYLNEIMGNALPKPATIQRPGMSIWAKIWEAGNLGCWLSAFLVFSLLTFLLYCWAKQKERNMYWADVNVEFVDLVEEESVEEGGDEGTSGSDTDDDRAGGGFGEPAKAWKNVSTDRSSFLSGSDTQPDEPLFYPGRKYYRYNYE